MWSLSGAGLVESGSDCGKSIAAMICGEIGKRGKIHTLRRNTRLILNATRFQCDLVGLGA